VLTGHEPKARFLTFFSPLFQSNPAARLGKLKEKRIAEIQPFSMAERKALLEKIHQCYQPLVRFLFESGFRLNEAFGLRWKNVTY
jgi:integrase